MYGSARRRVGNRGGYITTELTRVGLPLSANTVQPDLAAARALPCASRDHSSRFCDSPAGSLRRGDRASSAGPEYLHVAYCLSLRIHRRHASDLSRRDESSAGSRVVIDSPFEDVVRPESVVPPTDRLTVYRSYRCTRPRCTADRNMPNNQATPTRAAGHPPLVPSEASPSALALAPRA